MPVKRLCWWLPRPSESKYRGSFPRYFEVKLLRLLNISPDSHKILHPFGGAAQYGDTVEPEWQRDHIEEQRITPTFWGDAHELDFIDDETYDLVIADPPYSREENKELYNCDVPIKYKLWVKEALRVLKVGGLLAIYHKNLMPHPRCCDMEYVIAVITRVHHSARICGVYRKFFC